MNLTYLSNSKSAVNGISVFSPSEKDNISKTNGLYLGRTSCYKMPFFLNTSELLNPHITIIGMTGSGKTYFMKSYLIRSRLQSSASIFILDWNGEYNELILYLDGDIITIDGANLPKANNLIDRVCSLNLSKIKDEISRKKIASKTFDMILEQMHNMQIDDRKKRIIVVDEAWKTFDNDNKLGQLFREGRKYGFSIIISTQLARDVNNEILANSGTIFVFKLQNGEDHSALIDSGIISQDLKKNLSCLNIGNCIVRLAYKREGNRHTNIIIKQIDGISTAFYLIKGGKLQIKISSEKFLEITSTVIKEGEARNAIINFIESNERSLDLTSFIRFLLKNGLKRKDIIPYLRLLGFDDLTIVNSYESTKKVLIESVI